MTDPEAAALKRALEDHRPEPGERANILRTLLAVQQVLGRVPIDSIGAIAEALAVPEAHVAGVLSYYPDLHVALRGRQVVRVCLGEACVANRSLDLAAELQRVLRVGFGETTTDGRTTLERVYCLGNCGVGPTVMIDETIYGRVSTSDLRAMIEPKSA
ncbi:MAG TPA: NAD(P)H-dependent oxidoreductase subunit E [Nitrospira sp.]|nr:NAD(P)H-dependent oxidoreductase subunit E [Nitrospira sp.]